LKSKKFLPFIVFLCFSTLFTSTFASVSAEEVFLFSKPLSGVYLIKDGTEERIIYKQGPHIAPRLSLDGEKILFHSSQGGKIGIWLTDQHGKEMERLCDGDQANWSPDGKKIVFRREGRIMEREIVSGIERIITPEDLFFCEFPSYLPDGKVIFVLKEEGKEKIFLIDSDKETPPEPLVEVEIMSAPKCSPDGKKIAYQDGAHIYLLDLSDRKISQLTMAGGVQSWPMWSEDSRSICYCQSPEALGGPWDICNVKIDSPQNVGFVARNVDISPDWRGSSPSTSTIVELKGNSINLWQIEESLKEREHWRAIPVSGNYNVAGEIVAENDWGIFYLSSKKDKLLIFPKEASSSEQEEVLGKEIELTVINKEGKPATEIESIYVLSNGKESAVLEVGFRSEEKDAMTAIFTVPRSRPFIGIKPGENVDKVYVKRDINLALLPDRFADDLTFNPHKYVTPRVLIPYTPFLIGLPTEGGMVLTITPSDKQKMWLIKGEEDFFEGVEVSTEGEDIFISILPGQELWNQQPPCPPLLRGMGVVPASDTNGWKINWANPFLAQWRVAMSSPTTEAVLWVGKGREYSRMWDEEALSKLKEPSLPIEEEFSEPPELSVIYVYGRSWNTPLDVVTPMDILQDTLGIERLRGILDIDGIRDYRTAEKLVPLHTFLTSQENRLWPEDNPGWPQVLDFSPIFQLIVRVRMVDRKGVESTVTHLCEDILNSLKGLDNRIEEYEKFLVSLKNFCKANRKQSVETDKFFTAIEENIEDLQSSLANLSITEIRKVSDSIAAVKSCSGTGEELWDRGEFYSFREISESSLSERQEILTKYRNFVKEIRNKAGVMITETEESKDIYEEIRRLTQNFLRERYYLEGDWRGEKPLE